MDSLMSKKRLFTIQKSTLTFKALFLKIVGTPKTGIYSQVCGLAFS
jgi:hypothetical protein